MSDTPASRIAAAIFAEPLILDADGELAALPDARVAAIWREALPALPALDPVLIAA